MISPLTGTLDFNNNQATNFRLENLGATPAAAQAGRAIFQTAVKQAMVDDGTNIRIIPSISGVLKGDLIYASADSTWTRLAVGSSAQVLAVGANQTYEFIAGADPLTVQVFS